MFPWQTNGTDMMDQGTRDFKKFVKLNDDQGADMMVSPLFYVRGQAGPSDTATFAASAASGTTETATLTLPANVNPPEWVEVVLINHADAAVSVAFAQTVNDFVSGTGTLNPTLPVSVSSVAASGGVEQVLIQYPFTSDGALVVTFTASAAMTNGGNVGAQIRWMD